MSKNIAVNASHLKFIKRKKVNNWKWVINILNILEIIWLISLDLEGLELKLRFSKKKLLKIKFRLFFYKTAMKINMRLTKKGNMNLRIIIAVGSHSRHLFLLLEYVEFLKEEQI